MMDQMKKIRAQSSMPAAEVRDLSDEIAAAYSRTARGQLAALQWQLCELGERILVALRLRR